MPLSYTQVSWPKDPDSAEGKLVRTLQDEQGLLSTRVNALKVKSIRPVSIPLSLYHVLLFASLRRGKERGEGWCRRGGGSAAVITYGPPNREISDLQTRRKAGG